MHRLFIGDLATSHVQLCERSPEVNARLKARNAQVQRTMVNTLDRTNDVAQEYESKFTCYTYQEESVKTGIGQA